MVKINDDTVINLNIDDAALVLRKDGTAQVFIPNIDGDEETPLHVELLIAIVVLMDSDNDNFIDTTLDRYSTIVEEKMTSILDKLDNTIKSDESDEKEPNDWWVDEPEPNKWK